MRTLWGSFEIVNVKLVTKMLQQHARRSLLGASDEVTAAPMCV